jgi:hypothetical protein
MKKEIFALLCVFLLKPITITIYGHICGFNPFNHTTYVNLLMYGAPVCKGIEWILKIYTNIWVACITTIALSIIEWIGKYIPGVS